MMALPLAWTSCGDNIMPPRLLGWHPTLDGFSLEVQHRPWLDKMVLILVHFRFMGMASFMVSKTWDHNSGIHGFGFWVQHCVLMATTLYGLHTGWFGKTKLYGFLVAPVICFFLAMVLVTSKCLVTFFVVVTCLKQHLSLKIWNIQKTFSTCFPCTKTQCTKSTCFNIALGASYSTECFLVLTSYTWNMLIASIYHAILLCAIEKLYHIYIYIWPKAPHILGYWKAKKIGIQKSWKIIMQAHFLMVSNVKKQLLAVFFSNLILLSFELKEAKPLTFLRSFNILS